MNAAQLHGGPRGRALPTAQHAAGDAGDAGGEGPVAGWAELAQKGLGYLAEQRRAPRLTDNRFDIVVTDLDMPEMDGFALLSAISLLPLSRGRPPVVVCSALLGEGLAERRPELRLAAVLLAKPVQPEDVLKAAEKAMKVGPARN